MQRHKTWFSFATALVCLFLPVLALAQAPAPSASPKHCFWSVQGKSNMVYLMGSLHLLNKKFYPLDKSIEDAFVRSERLILEVDLKEMGLEAERKMRKMGRYPEGDSLKNHLSKETYDKLGARLKTKGGSAAAVDAFKPWMVAMSLIDIELDKLGFKMEDGVDRYFYNKATELSKKVEGLETADFHVRLFDELTKEEAEGMLKEIIDELDKLPKELEELTEAWKVGDTKKIEESAKGMLGYPGVYKKFIVDRNQRWSEQMDKLLAGGKDVFVVVGAAHLAGKDSLVGLLELKGYKVIQK